MTSKTILYVIGSLELGGAERHIAAIAPELKTRGWQPSVYCIAARGSQASDVEQHGVKVIAPSDKIAKSRTSIGKLVRFVSSVLKLFWLLATMRPAIVHFFLPAAYIIGAPIAIVTRTPIRVMSRRSLNLYQNKHPYARRFELALHRHMRMLIGNSQAVVQELQTEAAGTVPVQLIYNGVDLSAFTQRTADSDGRSLRLIIVANLIPYKGHADLFRALALIAAQLPATWELLCVGRDDGIGASLTKLAHELKIETHVKLFGSRNDIPALLASADVGILCSHEEGFSNAILEGMAVGLPMVVTDVGGNAEAVIDGETGFVVPASDPRALGIAVLKIVSDGELRRKMGSAARRRVEQHFSMTKCVERYEAVYESLLKELCR